MPLLRMNTQSDTTPAGPPIGPDKPWLAPLAGYSDLPFRLLCREYGAACACTEMISARGLTHKSPGTEQLLGTCPEDTPLVCQVYGSEPEIMSQAMEELLRRGFRFFDLNVGCSVPKVCKTGCGAAMLRTPDVLYAVAGAIVAQAGKGAVGVKLRLGWAMQQDCYLETAAELERLGVAWLTLHPRYAKQGFSGRAHWEQLKKLKQSVQIPVLASGDLFTARDAVRCLEETGVDGVMFARGALTDPAVFNRYLDLLHNKDRQVDKDGLRDRKALLELFLRHCELSHSHGNPYTSFLKMRFFAPRYLRHVSDARTLRKRVVSCKDWNALKTLFEEHLDDSSETGTEL